MKRFRNWLAPRWGQMVCFWGAFFAFGRVGEEGPGPNIALAISGVGLLFTGLGLKALAAWQVRESAKPTPPKPE